MAQPGGGGACRPRILRLRHQRNKRPREPRSSFASSQEITTLAYLVDYSKLHSLGEIEISENDGRNDSGSHKHQAVLFSHAELWANISGFRHGLEFETGLVYRDSLLGRSGAWKGNSSSPSGLSCGLHTVFFMRFSPAQIQADQLMTGKAVWRGKKPTLAPDPVHRGIGHGTPPRLCLPI
jgi:hypothetical protein